MRLFVAIDVPQQLKDAIETDVVGALRPQLSGARWTRPEGRHLTLKFLGNVDEERVDEITDVMVTVAIRHEAFDANFAYPGVFPNHRRPRVLWLGLGGAAERVALLAADLDLALQPLGFEKETRGYSPHLTLARFHEQTSFDHEVLMFDAPPDMFRVDSITLFESKLHPKGARYSTVATAPLRMKT